MSISPGPLENANRHLPVPARDASTWILTFTGRQVWPLNPRPDDFDLVDIAHALSNICRFTGHVRTFYSVAQHCVIMTENAPEEIRREVLMHDAAEAYLADVARPIKKELRVLKVFETRLELCIATRFSLRFSVEHGWPAGVAELDLRALATERRDLMEKPPIPWRSTETVEPFEREIKPVGPDAAKAMFLAFAERLGLK